MFYNAVNFEVKYNNGSDLHTKQYHYETGL